MCGIFGVVSNVLPDNKIIKDALDSIKHRGPDDEGFFFANISENTYTSASGTDTCPYLKEELRDLFDVNISKYQLVLANRRLAIIDLSPKGHQPMSYENNNLWITYNGEIFNYKELKTELKSMGHRFYSDTDTEVILAAYSEWGEDCVSRFNGQWAFCIYNKRKKGLFCSRDRFGIKPFYYWFDGKHFAFASEIKALLKLPFLKKEINKSAISDFIIFHMHHHTRESLYKKIYQLLPSHKMNIDLNKMSIHIDKYYELKFNDELGEYDHHQALRYADDVRDILVDAVKVRLISDVPVGSCLSGGLDSSSIVLIINKLLREGGIQGEQIGRRQKTFTASFDDPSVDERMYAEEVIGHTDVDSFFVYPTAEKLWKEVDDFLFYQDGLCKSTNVYGGWNVMRLASNHVRVVLNGQGGDELFGGYPRYEPVYLADIIRKMRIKDIIKFFISKSRLYGLNHSFDAILKGGYLALIPDSLKVFLFRQRNKDRFRCIENLLGEPDLGNIGFNRMADRIKSLNYQLYCDIAKDYLLQLLHEDDRNGAAFSIENRVPFIDHRLVEYVNRIPSIYKLYKGWSKWILRLAMRDLLPEKILWRKDKIGFLTPVETWIKHKDSPMLLLMKQYDLNKYDPYFAWKFYVGSTVIR